MRRSVCLSVLLSVCRPASRCYWLYAYGGEFAHYSFKVKGQKSRSPGWLMLSLKCDIFRMERPTKFKLGTQMEHEDPYRRQAPYPRSRSRLSRGARLVLAHKSRTKSPTNTKIGRKVAHPTGNNEHQFQGQKVKGQDHLANYCPGYRRNVVNVKPLIRCHRGRGYTVSATQLIIIAMGVCDDDNNAAVLWSEGLME